MTIQLHEDEIKRLKELEERWNILTSRLGKLYYQRKAVNAELELTDRDLTELDNERFQVISELQKKYGEGTVNLESHTFSPKTPK